MHSFIHPHGKGLHFIQYIWETEFLFSTKVNPLLSFKHPQDMETHIVGFLQSSIISRCLKLHSSTPSFHVQMQAWGSQMRTCLHLSFQSAWLVSVNCADSKVIVSFLGNCAFSYHTASLNLLREAYLLHSTFRAHASTMKSIDSTSNVSSVCYSLKITH